MFKYSSQVLLKKNYIIKIYICSLIVPLKVWGTSDICKEHFDETFSKVALFDFKRHFGQHG